MILESDFQYFDYKPHILYYIVKNSENSYPFQSLINISFTHTVQIYKSEVINLCNTKGHSFYILHLCMYVYRIIKNNLYILLWLLDEHFLSKGANKKLLFVYIFSNMSKLHPNMWINIIYICYLQWKVFLIF